MKNFKYLSILFVAITLFSCSSDSDTTPETPTDETAGLVKIQDLSNDNHIIELYSETGKLTQGYNQISLRVKDKNTNTYITNASLNWTPIMNMTTMQHSCPKSSIEKISEKQTLYTGNIIFQMAQNDADFWELKINYSINAISYSVTAPISVFASDKRTVNSFTGTDSVRYVLAYIAPKAPKIGLNNMSVGLYKMQDMMTFAVVDNFKVKIDPRMPSMGNHSSPNNTDLIQSTSQGFYNGNLSLTMTGYWKINLQLLNAAGEVLKGEDFTPENVSSSLFFEIEF
ncbi:hypothetical protein [Flavobacterium hydatis]|uniref:YtkA-like domain-containing protein n=1 Tax=Flavobacterium hydatis TaxID=991 RepID=A0A086A1U6_FLAHY|nr:hypothetical protein [Flavobacterium hydatis]KFF10660.1 hypothetical protein IW20_20545 [Flavobacterium hydatis]OXA94287.1 hypothetical protein B0A62_11580 [Flavobacterium hydatis]